MDVKIISDFIMLGVVLMQVGVVVGIVGLFLSHNRWSQLVVHHALSASFIIVLASVLGSFYYSDILGFEPCKLCVYQRWVMISQFVVLMVAVARSDRNILPYVGALSVTGFCIAIFHAFILPFLGSSVICLPSEVSCLTGYVTGFGYITIPIMSLTVFALLVVLWIYEVRSNRQMAEML